MYEMLYQGECRNPVLVEGLHRMRWRRLIHRPAYFLQQQERRRCASLFGQYYLHEHDLKLKQLCHVSIHRMCNVLFYVHLRP
jgi:hypothetical protein